MFSQITPISISQEQGLQITRHVILTIILLICIGLQAVALPPPCSLTMQAGDSARGAAQSADEELSLEPGKPIERELSGGQSHFYKIAMTSGQYLQVTVGQRGIDALVSLFTPDGKKIGEVDSEQATVGAETILAIAEATGAYRIDVRSAEKTAQTGRYEIKVEELREATAEDEYRVAAESLFREAEQLRKGTLEAKRKGIEKYQEALELYRRAGDREGEAEMLNNIGAVYWLLGETQKALENYNEALPIRRVAGDRKGEAITLTNLGVVYRSLGETQKALDKHSEALSIFRSLGDRRMEAMTLSNTGKVYLLLGEIREAMEKLNEALTIKRAIGDCDGESVTLLWIARAEHKRGALPQARQTIEQAISIVESLRADISIQGLRSSFLATRRECYESYIDILMEQRKQKPAASFDAAAFEVSERARARSLLELLTESRIDVCQGVDGSLLERERSLRQLLNVKAAAQVALLSRKRTPAQAEAAAKEIASITTQYEELRAQIRARSPRYADLTQPQPLSLAEIQRQVLDPDTLLLEYLLGDDASHLFVVSKTSITWRQLPKRAEIEAATRRVRELLTAPQPQPDDTEAKYQARIKEARENYWPQAAELSRMLLGPAASQLSGKHYDCEHPSSQVRQRR